MVDWFLRNHRRSTYFCILGMTLGSIVAVVVQAVDSMAGSPVEWTIIAGITVGIVAGLVIGYLISRVSSKYAEETIEGEHPAE